MKKMLPVGTRYTSSRTYDAATNEVVHGWQVFAQYREDGTPTGRKSFVDNNGNLCGIEIAKTKREQAVVSHCEELAQMVETLTNGLRWNIENNVLGMHESDAEALAEAEDLLFKVRGQQ